jgi:hypothetical protein
MNRAIELHDSRVSSIGSDGDRITLLFEPAYIHESEGRPGIDGGTGWSQRCQLRFAAASMEGTLPELPSDLMGGELIFGAEVYGNLIPMPLEVLGAVSLRLLFYPGCETTISGASLALKTLGTPRFVEEVRSAREGGLRVEAS